MFAVLCAACGFAGGRQVQEDFAIAPLRNAHGWDEVLQSQFIAHPTPGGFSVCYGHTCRHIARVGLRPEEWQTVTALFVPQADTAAGEREVIRAAIAMLERLVGVQTGTVNDRGGNFTALGQPGQLDCVDEAINTTVYLRLLQDAGLLRWHRVERPVSRGFLELTAPHNTAVISELDSRARFAVDAWFLDNGTPPYIVPLAQWRSGWKPEADLVRDGPR
jgi:hypothetical protein